MEDENSKMIEVTSFARRTIGYTQMLAGEPDEIRRGKYGTAVRVGREWFSVHLIWSERQMNRGDTPYASRTLGIDPSIELWGVRCRFDGEPKE